VSVDSGKSKSVNIKVSNDRLATHGVGSGERTSVNESINTGKCRCQ